MTESEWLSSNNLAAMLDFARNPAHAGIAGQPYISDRKLRLFACACCRQVWHLLVDDAPCGRCGGHGYRIKDKHGHDYEIRCRDCNGTGRVNRSRRAVEVAERYADGEATADDLRGAVHAAQRAFAENGNEWNGPPTLLLTYPRNPVHLTATWLPFAVQAALLREIIGNPWRPVTLRVRKGDGLVLLSEKKVRRCQPGVKPDLVAVSDEHGVDVVWAATHKDGRPDVYSAQPHPWLTPDVVSLARAAYEERPGRECVRCAGSGVVDDHSDPTGCSDMPCPGCGGTGRIDDGALDPERLVVLSDALEEAGCSDAALLWHLRGYEPHVCAAHCGRRHSEHCPLAGGSGWRPCGPHVRGCWAVDLCLGKE